MSVSAAGIPNAIASRLHRETALATSRAVCRARGRVRRKYSANLRHSLATYLIAVGRDVKTVQTILRHANPMTTLQLYAHGRSQDRSDAQDEMLTAFFKSSETIPASLI